VDLDVELAFALFAPAASQVAGPIPQALGEIGFPIADRRGGLPADFKKRSGKFCFKFGALETRILRRHLGNLIACPIPDLGRERLAAE